MSYCDRLLRKTINQAKKLVIKKNIDRFLDTGIGDGNITKEFMQLLNPKETYGVDIQRVHCDTVFAKSIKCVQFDLNLYLSYPKDYFDFILSNQVIEHLYNTAQYLSRCQRLLKPEGQIILTTENLSSWFNIFALFFGWQPFSSTSINGLRCGNALIKKSIEEDENGSHVRVLAYQGLKDLFTMTGFRNIKIKGGRHSHFLAISAFK